jgi:hypothetical protein
MHGHPGFTSGCEALLVQYRGRGPEHKKHLSPPICALRPHQQQSVEAERALSLCFSVVDLPSGKVG